MSVHWSELWEPWLLFEVWMCSHLVSSSWFCSLSTFPYNWSGLAVRSCGHEQNWAGDHFVRNYIGSGGKCLMPPCVTFEASAFSSCYFCDSYWSLFNSWSNGDMQTEEARRSLVLFINTVLVIQLSLLWLAGRSILLLYDAELRVKYASMGPGLVTVYSFISIGMQKMDLHLYLSCTLARKKSYSRR